MKILRHSIFNPPEYNILLSGQKKTGPSRKAVVNTAKHCTSQCLPIKGHGKCVINTYSDCNCDMCIMLHFGRKTVHVKFNQTFKQKRGPQNSHWKGEEIAPLLNKSKMWKGGGVYGPPPKSIWKLFKSKVKNRNTLGQRPSKHREVHRYPAHFLTRRMCYRNTLGQWPSKHRKVPRYPAHFLTRRRSCHKSQYEQKPLGYKNISKDSKYSLSPSASNNLSKGKQFNKECRKLITDKHGNLSEIYMSD